MCGVYAYEHEKQLLWGRFYAPSLLLFLALVGKKKEGCHKSKGGSFLLCLTKGLFPLLSADEFSSLHSFLSPEIPAEMDVPRLDTRLQPAQYTYFFFSFPLFGASFVFILRHYLSSPPPLNGDRNLEDQKLLLWVCFFFLFPRGPLLLSLPCGHLCVM